MTFLHSRFLGCGNRFRAGRDPAGGSTNGPVTKSRTRINRSKHADLLSCHIIRTIPQYCSLRKQPSFLPPGPSGVSRERRTAVFAGYQYCNERSSPQAKIHSEMPVFEHGDLHFSLHNNSARIILFNFKKFLQFLSDGKEVKACTKPLLWDVIYDREKNDYRDCAIFVRKGGGGLKN